MNGPVHSRLFPDFDGLPLMNAAGTVKTVEQARALLGLPVPAILLGSYTLEERAGNHGRTFFELPGGALNSMGLPGPAMSTWTAWVRDVGPMVRDSGKELWVSVAGFNPPEFARLAEAAFEAGADAVEANLGCPNIWHAGDQKPIVSQSVEQTALVLDELRRATGLGRLGVKLSPIFDALLLSALDAELVRADVAFVTCMNTVPNSYAFAADGQPAITFGTGLAGLSGPAVLWIGLGQAVAHRRHLTGTSLVAVGGIDNGRDLAEYLGDPIRADACQVATAFWLRGPRALVEIMQDYAETVDVE